MAATLLGITTLTFGVPTVSGLIVNNVSFSESSNQSTLIDEDGDYVAAAIHGRKVTGKVSGTLNGGTFTIGSTLAVTGAPTGTYYVTEISRTRTADGFQQIDMSLDSFGL